MSRKRAGALKGIALLSSLHAAAELPPIAPAPEELEMLARARETEKARFRASRPPRGPRGPYRKKDKPAPVHTVRRRRGRPRMQGEKVLNPRRPASRPVKHAFPGVCRVALARQLGMHRVSITRILSGRLKPGRACLERLAAAIGVTPGSLEEKLIQIQKA